MSGASAQTAAAKATAEAAPMIELRTSHDSLAGALVAALEDLTVVEKGRKAKIPTKDGGSYTYDFADIADVVKLTRPILARHGLVALTPIHAHDGGLACTVKIVHEGGDMLDLGPFSFPAGRDAQSTGSAVTYHRRYALVAALGIAAGDDDDGQAATASANRPQAQPEPAWTRADAKNRMLAQVGEKLAAAAWENFDGDHRWKSWEHAFPTEAVEKWENDNPADIAGGENPADTDQVGDVS